MRTAILIALVATGITMIGCDWFANKRSASTTFRVKGDWRLDSLEAGPDSSNVVNGLELPMALGLRNDSTPLTYSFSNDSIVTIVSTSASDTGYYQLDTVARQFVLRSDTTEHRYGFVMLNDSLFSLTAPDSTVLWLKKQTVDQAVSK